MRPHDLIAAWQGKTAYVVGDAMHDEYHFGHVDRLSPEAPVPVFLVDQTDTRPGGAANVAANLRAFGLTVLETFGQKPWSVKTRYISGHQQLFRHDADRTSTILEALDSIREKVQRCDVLVLSDYAKGVLSQHWCGVLVGAARELGKPCVVDPKGKSWDKYVGCSVICPNEAEMSAWLDNGAATRPVFPAVLAKHGPKGLALMYEDVGSGGEREQRVKLYPTEAQHVYDVTGAGDTVVAVVAATLAAGGTLEEAAPLANLAAAVVIAEVGTVACTREALERRL